MSAPTDTDEPLEVAERVAELRPLLTQTLRAIAPNLPLIDCARIVNEALDRFEEGDRRGVRLMLDILQRVRDESEKAARGAEATAKPENES